MDPSLAPVRSLALAGTSVAPKSVFAAAYRVMPALLPTEA